MAIKLFPTIVVLVILVTFSGSKLLGVEGQPGKVCGAQAGQCSDPGCLNDCCNQRCSDKYRNGVGVCAKIGVVAYPCFCTFPCSGDAPTNTSDSKLSVRS